VTTRRSSSRSQCGSDHPSIAVVVDQKVPSLFAEWRRLFSLRVGLQFIQWGDAVIAQLQLPDMYQPTQPLTDEVRPLIREAFKVRIGLPNPYPPALGAQIASEVLNSTRELLRRLGYSQNESPVGWSMFNTRSGELRSGKASVMSSSQQPRRDCVSQTTTPARLGRTSVPSAVAIFPPTCVAGLGGRRDRHRCCARRSARTEANANACRSANRAERRFVTSGLLDQSRLSAGVIIGLFLPRPISFGRVGGLSLECAALSSNFGFAIDINAGRSRFDCNGSCEEQAVHDPCAVGRGRVVAQPGRIASRERLPGRPGPLGRSR
jgi:hypothetical protein